jgi:exonuclease VII large subunit
MRQALLGQFQGAVVSGAANLTSIETIRELKAALQEFQADLRDAITGLLLEVRRELDWIENDRARYWPREFQRASDRVAEARHDLERHEMALRSEDKRSCYEAKLALEAARRRMRLTENKIRAVRKWRVTLHREADQFEGRLARLNDFLDTDIPRSLATLERMAAALDRYTETRRPEARRSGGESAAGGTVHQPPGPEPPASAEDSG